MASCPRCGNDADYLPGDIFILVNCDFCGDTIDITEFAGRVGGDETVRPLQAPAERPGSPRDLQVA